MYAWVTALVCFFSGNAFADDLYVAGNLSYARNIVIAVDVNDASRIVTKGSEIYAGDELVTKDNSYAQIEFTDESRLTVRPNSKIIIADYYFDQDEPSKDIATFKLIHGGFYSETGLIGKRGNPDAYRVDSSIANIGVRGTRYAVYLCNQNSDAECGNQTDLDAASLATNGLYVGVSSGAVELSNEAGKKTLSQGEFAYASDSYSSPIYVDQPMLGLETTASQLPLDGCSIGY